MKHELIEKLICPFDKQSLHLEIFKEDENNNIIEGVFSCSNCQRYYPISYGIPIFSPDEYRVPELEKPLLDQWELMITSDFKLLKS